MPSSPGSAVGEEADCRWGWFWGCLGNGRARKERLEAGCWGDRGRL